MSDTQQAPDWWQASDGKWYPPESHPDYRPPEPAAPPPPPTVPGPPPPDASQSYTQPAPERPTTTAAFICGIIGSVIGLIPLLGIFAIPLGLIGFVLGLMGWRRKPERAKLARASTILGVVAVALGVIGIVIVSNAFDDLEEDLQDIAEGRDTPSDLEAVPLGTVVELAEWDVSITAIEPEPAAAPYDPESGVTYTGWRITLEGTWQGEGEEFLSTPFSVAYVGTDNRVYQTFDCRLDFDANTEPLESAQAVVTGGSTSLQDCLAIPEDAIGVGQIELRAAFSLDDDDVAVFEAPGL